MFEEAFYYISEGLGDRRMNIWVAVMGFEEFYHEYRIRFGRAPFIVNMVNLSEDEFDATSEHQMPDYIFDGR